MNKQVLNRQTLSLQTNVVVVVVVVVVVFNGRIHHEEVQGQFDFTGRRDVRAFMQLAQEVGLKVCAGWHSSARLLTHARTHARTRSFTHWLTRSRTHTRTHALTHSPTHSLNDTLTHSPPTGSVASWPMGPRGVPQWRSPGLGAHGVRPAPLDGPQVLGLCGGFLRCHRAAVEGIVAQVSE